MVLFFDFDIFKGIEIIMKTFTYLAGVNLILSSCIISLSEAAVFFLFQCPEMTWLNILTCHDYTIIVKDVIKASYLEINFEVGKF